MKRFFQTIAILAVVAFAASACQSDALAPAEPSTPALVAPGIDITISEVADNSFKFTIAPRGESCYYSYLVSSVDSELDSASLYSVSYKDIMQGTVKYADNPSFTATVEGLESYTDYYVYAVASSVEGNVGSVYRKSVQTLDTSAPALTGYDYNENQVLLEFSEDITYVEGKEVYAVVYAGLYLTGSPVIEHTAATVITGGNQVLLTFPAIVTPGSYYTINYPAGTFVDQVGTPCAALESRFYSTGSGVGLEGLYGALENAPLEVVLPEVGMIEELESWISVGVPSMVNRIDSKAQFITTITHVEEVDGAVSTTETVVPMKAVTHFGGSYYAILVRPAGNPKPKDLITITIPAGACTDIYGNVNDEIVLGPYKYAYTPVYPKTGDYLVKNGEYPFQIRLSAVSAEDPEAGYVLQADWFQLFEGKGFANPTLYFTVDEPNRQLICNDQRVLNDGSLASAFGAGYYYYDEAHTQLLVFWGGGNSGTEPIVISYDDSGLLTTMSYCDYSVHNASSGAYLGVFDSIIDNVEIVPANAASAPKKAPARIKNVKVLASEYDNFTFRK